MFGGWLNNKPAEGDSQVQNPADNINRNDVPLTHAATQASAVHLTPAKDNLSEPADPSEASSSKLQPHDAIVQDMDERLRALQLAGQPASSTSPRPDTTSGAASPSTDPPDARTSRGPENIYDPFNGQSIGLLAPGDFDRAEDDLWTHLKQIRDLQAEIAGMHAQMEGLGGNERRPRRRETTGDDEALNVEEEAKAAKAAEFMKLADRFTGRKDAIDAIMAKLETLSHTINDFHSNRAPSLRVQSCSPDPMSFGGRRPSNRDSISKERTNRVLSEEHGMRDSPDSSAQSYKT